MQRPAGLPAGLLLRHERGYPVRRILLMVLTLALAGAGCQLIAPPSPDAPRSPSLPLPSSAPPRLSPSIEIPPPQ